MEMTFPPKPAAKPLPPVSPVYKQQIRKLTAYIGLFLFTFLVLTGTTVLLGYLAVQYEIWLYTDPDRDNARIIVIWSFCFGLLALMVFFGLLSFLFRGKKEKKTDYLEITEQKQPELFAFVRKTAEEADAPMPRRIYLEPGVNAAVLIKTSFRNLFFPGKKDLLIGMGLLQVLNTSELKAILAHEFAHFSQKGTKMGSYIYQFNRIVHERISRVKTFKEINNSSTEPLGAFAEVVKKVIAEVYLFLLRLEYRLINLAFAKLSREMEFQADAIAASVAGGNNAITGLRKAEFSGHAFGSVIDYYNRKALQKVKPANVYAAFQALLMQRAARYDLKVEQGLFFTGKLDPDFLKPSQVRVNEQWASHPGQHAREAQLEKLGYYAHPVDMPAKQLLRDLDSLQALLTIKLFEPADPENQFSRQSLKDFKQEFLVSPELISLMHRFNGYYTGTSIEPFDLDAAVGEALVADQTPETLYAKSFVALRDQYVIQHQDLRQLEAIKEAKTGVWSFDYKGQKYPKRKVAKVMEQLKAEMEATREQMEHHDKAIFSYFLAVARKAGKEQLLIDYYDDHLLIRREEERLGNYNLIVTMELGFIAMSKSPILPMPINEQEKGESLKKYHNLFTEPARRMLEVDEELPFLSMEDAYQIRKFLDTSDEYYTSLGLSADKPGLLGKVCRAVVYNCRPYSNITLKRILELKVALMDGNA